MTKFSVVNFYFYAQNKDCGYTLEPLNIDREYTLEPPRRGGSNEYPQSLFWSKKGISLHTPVLLYESGIQGGIHYTDMLS